MPYVRNDLFDLAQCGGLPLDEHRFGRGKQRAFTKRVPKQLVVKDYLMRTTSPGRFTAWRSWPTKWPREWPPRQSASLSLQPQHLDDEVSLTRRARTWPLTLQCPLLGGKADR